VEEEEICLEETAVPLGSGMAAVVRWKKMVNIKVMFILNGGQINFTDI
jgi:hypothetical protein